MDKIIRFESQKETQGLLGAQDAHLKSIEKEFKVKLTLRGEHLKISGSAANINKAGQLIEYLLAGLRSGSAEIGQADLAYLISNLKKSNKSLSLEQLNTGIIRSCAGKQIGPKTIGQSEYVEAIQRHDIVFGIGPAGTGKTYLAMACAVEALKKQEVRRIILTRPAIEAGESLGFLPGDLEAKISPYLRPLYDAL
ncbi:MAG: PhoH family protein, partial [Candidatus Omnitrophota bacterium]